MKSAKRFYLIFMELAQAVNQSTSRAQLSKNIGQYVQSLAECFDDDGLDVMEDYHLAGGYMASDDLYPVLKQFSVPNIHKHHFYEMTTVNIPLKSKNKSVNTTNKTTYSIFTYPSKALVKSYMLALLDMAMEHTINHFKHSGVRWSDNSYITPLEEYRMRIIMSIRTPRNFTKKAVYAKHYKFLTNIHNMRDLIAKNHSQMCGLQWTIRLLHRAY